MARENIDGTKNIVDITKFYQKHIVGITVCLIFGVIGNSKAKPITHGRSGLTNYPLEDSRSNFTFTQYIGHEANKNEAQNYYSKSLRTESVDLYKLPSYRTGPTNETNAIMDLSRSSKARSNQDGFSNQNIERRRKRNNMKTESKQLNKGEFSKYNNSLTLKKRILPNNFTKSIKSVSQYNHSIIKKNPQQFIKLISGFKEKNIKKRYIGIESSADVEIIINPEYETKQNESIIDAGFKEKVKKRSVGIESSADVEIVINPEYDVKQNESNTSDNEFHLQNLTNYSQEQESDDADYQNDESESYTESFDTLSLVNSSFSDSKPHRIKNLKSNQLLKSRNSTRYDPKIPIKMQNFLSDIAVELMLKNSNLNLVNTSRNGIMKRDKINKLNSTEILMVIKRFIDKKSNGNGKKFRKSFLQQFQSYLKNNPQEIDILKSNYEEKTVMKRFVGNESNKDVEKARNPLFEIKQNESVTNIIELNFSQNLTTVSPKQDNNDADYQNDPYESDCETVLNLSVVNNTFSNTKPRRSMGIKKNKELMSRSSTRFNNNISLRMQNLLSDIAAEFMSTNSDLNPLKASKNGIMKRDEVKRLNSTEMQSLIKRFINKELDEYNENENQEPPLLPYHNDLPLHSMDVSHAVNDPYEQQYEELSTVPLNFNIYFFNNNEPTTALPPLIDEYMPFSPTREYYQVPKYIFLPNIQYKDRDPRRTHHHFININSLLNNLRIKENEVPFDENYHHPEGHEGHGGGYGDGEPSEPGGPGGPGGPEGPEDGHGPGGADGADGEDGGPGGPGGPGGGDGSDDENACAKVRLAVYIVAGVTGILLFSAITAICWNSCKKQSVEIRLRDPRCGC